MNEYRLHIIALLMLLVVGCNPQPEAKKILRDAQLIVDEQPDIAKTLIDSIFYPERSLGRRQYMEFLVAQVQVKHKTYRSVAGDTLIFKAIQYLENKNTDTRKTASAYFYGGCVYRERQEYEDAMSYYKKAEQYASKAKDDKLKGLVLYNIGDLLTGQGLHKQALDNYVKAERVYNQSPDKLYEKRAHCFGAMGRMYALLEKPDSAFFYFNKGIQIAKDTGDDMLQSLLAQNLSVIYKRMGEYKTSETFLRQSYMLNRDSTQLARYYLNFAGIYSGLEQLDSTRYYTNMLKDHIQDTNDSYLKASAYNYLSRWEQNLGNYDDAFDYQNKYASILEDIRQENLKQSVYEIQSKYDYERMKNETERQVSFFMLWIIILLLAIVVGGGFLSFHFLKQKNKLIHVQQQTEFLKNIAVELQQSHKHEMAEKTQTMRELLLWKMNVVKKSALLGRYDNGNLTNAQLINEFYKIVYQDNKHDHWYNILVAFDQINPGVSEKLKTSYPKLTQTDFKMAILTYAGMTIRDISFILDLSVNTVQTYRHQLRKKLKIEDSSIEMALFLREVLV